MFKKHLLTAFGAVSLALTASMALADDVASYPDRQVRMIVPFPPGGSVDYIARIVVPEFAKQLGETVYIENKGGASASIGTAELARSKPDGYTLQFIFDTHAVNPHIMDNLSYDTFEDFEYITGITSAPMVLATSPSFEIDNLPDFIEYAKENPDEITYGSSGVGGSNHLTALNFSQMADISTLHVPYTGGGPMLTAL